MENIDNGMREMKDLGIAGYIRFTIKADDTEDNKAVHDAFKEFCSVECGNDYTLGLRVLLRYYEDDAKFAALFNEMQRMKEDLTTHVESCNKRVEQKTDNGAF